MLISGRGRYRCSHLVGGDIPVRLYTKSLGEQLCKGLGGVRGEGVTQDLVHLLLRPNTKGSLTFVACTVSREGVCILSGVEPTILG